MGDGNPSPATSLTGSALLSYVVGYFILNGMVELLREEELAGEVVASAGNCPIIGNSSEFQKSI